MGLTLSQAPEVDLPLAVTEFIAHATASQVRSIYTDGSFAVSVPLLDLLSLPPTDLATTSGVAATGVYLPSTRDAGALALLIQTPTRAVTDAYYQELLGTTISMLLSIHTPLRAFSDCSSAIRRTQQALYSLGPLLDTSNMVLCYWASEQLPLILAALPHSTGLLHIRRGRSLSHNGRRMTGVYTKRI